jgi:phospholipase C
VSWIVPEIAHTEHPSFPPSPGAEGIMRVLSTLVGNPAIWERTALIVSYDENGGFFDHVAPPTSPVGTPGEYVTDPAAHGIAGHASVGLGFRVPALIISPFSRGGRLFSEVSDHVSQLKLIARRFGLRVPNVSAWRDATVSDLSAALQRRPHSGSTPSPVGVASAATEAAGDLAEIRLAARLFGAGITVPPNSKARQERTPVRRTLPG